MDLTLVPLYSPIRYLDTNDFLGVFFAFFFSFHRRISYTAYTVDFTWKVRIPI